MSENIECGLVVSKVVNTVTEDQTVAVTLKGQKTITHSDTGFDLEDIVEVSVTLKFSMPRTAKALGIPIPGSAKILSLRDRDESLSGYEVEIHPAMQQKIM